MPTRAFIFSEEKENKTKIGVFSTNLLEPKTKSFF
jgi:hypothetical protein